MKQGTRTTLSTEPPVACLFYFGLELVTLSSVKSPERSASTSAAPERDGNFPETGRFCLHLGRGEHLLSVDTCMVLFFCYWLMRPGSRSGLVQEFQKGEKKHRGSEI